MHGNHFRPQVIDMSYDFSLNASSDREQIAELDSSDPLAKWRNHFKLPGGITYFDGMSLGPLTIAASEKISEAVEDQWGRGLIRSWNSAGWINAPERVGTLIAPLLGVMDEEVVVGDSTSVNLFRLLIAAIRLRPDRNVIVIESNNFPTDIYVARGVEKLHPHVELRVVEHADLDAAMDHDVAVCLLTHVDYKTSRVHDMAARTARAHEVGAMMLWDLSHSTGAVPLNLNECQVDLAVGCGYKYLNGGPGAPSFMFVAQRHLATLDQPITAWMGHAEPFEFSMDYEPASGIRQLLSGTPMILSLAALEASLGIWNNVDVRAVRAKTVAMSELMIRLIEQEIHDPELRLASPRDPQQRGGHLAFQHPQGYSVMQALIDRGVIGDFRNPDIMRFGFAPLYMKFADVAKAVSELADILERRIWDQAKYQERSAVT